MNVRELTLGVLLAGFEGAGPEEVPEWLPSLIGEGLAGVTLFGRNIVPEDTVARLRGLVSHLRRGAPRLLVAIDEEGGDVTRLDRVAGSAFLGARSLGVIDDVAVTRRSAGLLAARLTDAGINLNFAPVADVDSEPNSPIVGSRSFSSDPECAGRHVAAAVEGHLTLGVACTAKHFPGHGATLEDSHLVVPTVTADAGTLRARELVPFRAAIAAGVPVIMTGHLRVPAMDPDNPATMSKRILTGLLRQEMGFRGVIVTDGLDMHAISRTIGHAEGVVRALLAGADLMCIGGDSVGPEVVDEIVEAVTVAVGSGRLPVERLAEARDRVRELADRFQCRNGDHHARATAELMPAAKASLRLVGDFPIGRPGTVVELHSTPSIVAGEVGWGMGRPLRVADPGLEVRRVYEGDAVPDLPPSPVVVSVKDCHLFPWQLEFVTALRRSRGDIVVVDHGGTADDELLGGHGIIAHDSSAVAAMAAAQVLLGGAGQAVPAT